MNLAQPPTSGIMAYCPVENNTPHEAGLETLHRALELCGGVGEPCFVAALGYGITAAAQALTRYGADEVVYCDHPRLRDYAADDYASALLTLWEQRRPRAVLFPATDTGRDLAARLAGALGMGLSADCIEISMDASSKQLVQTRAAFNGNVLAVIQSVGEVQLATLRPGGFTPAPALARQSKLTALPCDFPPARTRVLRRAAALPPEQDLMRAQVVVGVGRGVKDQAGVELARRLARALGGMLGASRAAVEAGLLPHELQIGQTGRVIRPRLYIACGISGSAQHLAGVKAKRMIALNHDKDAPIFQEADYGVCADLFETLPALTQLLLRESGKES